MADTEPRKVPVQRRARQTVRAMLDATAHILASGEPLNTNRIAEVAGVSIGSLYQYFPSKESLIAALVERMLEDDLDWMAGRLTDGPVRPQVPGLVRDVCRRQAKQAALMAALLPLLSVVERDAAARTMFDRIVDLLRSRLAADPGLRPELADPAQLDRALFVVSRSMRWCLNEAAISHPEWLNDPGFHAEIAVIVDGLWAPLPARPDVP